MKTIKELRKDYAKAKIELENEYKNNVKKRLQDLGLDKLVKRKDDGKIGVLELDGVRVEFYPLTKKGTKRIYSEGYICEVEAEFEPYNEESEA